MDGGRATRRHRRSEGVWNYGCRHARYEVTKNKVSSPSFVAHTHLFHFSFTLLGASLLTTDLSNDTSNDPSAPVLYPGDKPATVVGRGDARGNTVLSLVRWSVPGMPATHLRRGLAASLLALERRYVYMSSPHSSSMFTKRLLR